MFPDNRNQHRVATKVPSSPVNISYGPHGDRQEIPHGVSSGMDQSGGDAGLQAGSPNQGRCRLHALIPAQAISQPKLSQTCHPCGLLAS
ncbi:hypothetical protein DSO57_1029447 [Entomophthora muscae]|uniref:Uncharacterized protein n=1 Tax=Entomophthora muscae TaxID=34485 RepID=A0ACC2RS62_9FUNG|nr:hypothetical protein DSO57_1029447 [Entomophthora muscae]